MCPFFVWNLPRPYCDFSSRNNNSTTHRARYSVATCFGLNSPFGKSVMYNRQPSSASVMRTPTTRYRLLSHDLRSLYHVAGSELDLNADVLPAQLTDDIEYPLAFQRNGAPATFPQFSNDQWIRTPLQLLTKKPSFPSISAKRR